MLTEFNEGGSHEQNPLGGIPQGMASNGQMNTVEQGETKKGNYVYSDRLYINEDLVKQMNLPTYIKGKTFANASKAINDKFKDRNDIHTKATQKELLDRLTGAQELLKQQEQQINQSMQDNMQSIEGSAQFEDGGFLDFIKTNGSNVGGIGTMLGSAINPNGYWGDNLEAANNAGYNNTHLQKAQSMNAGLDAISGTVAKSFGPVGEAIFGGKKLLEGAAGAIGGEAGAIASSIISPEKAALANITDKNLSIGQKALGMLPGVGGVIANKSANRKLKDFQADRSRAENFYKYQFDENNNNTKIFKFGGNIDEPATNPLNKKISINSNDNIQKSINSNLNISKNSNTSKSNLLGEIKLINKRNDGYGILYDTDEGEKYEVVKNNAFKEMENLPELKRYRFKRGEYNDPEFLKDPLNVEALKRGWQSSGYTPNLVKYPESIEAYRAAIGQPAFYSPEQLTSMSKQFKKGGYITRKPAMYVEGGNINPLDPLNQNNILNKFGSTTPPLNFKGNSFSLPNARQTEYSQNLPYGDTFPNGIYSAPTNNVQADRFPNGIYQASELSLEEQLANNPDLQARLIDFKNPSLATPGYNSKSKGFDYKKIGDSLSNTLRYAPIFGNLMQKNRIGPAEVDQAIKNNYQYQRQLMDTNKLENIATQQAVNTNQGLAQAGLTGNQLMSAMLATQLNRTKGISDAYNTVNQHNINENKIAEQVKQQNQGDYTNDLRYVRETNAQNRANRDTQRSKFDAEIYNSLGEIGKENIFKKQAEKLTGYSWMGDYLLSNPEYKAKFDAIEKDPTLDDTSKYARKQQLTMEYFKSMSPEQLAAVEANTNDIATKHITKRRYGGYMTPNFKKY